MKFWHDLRRRRVFRFAGLYIVGSWLVFQVADVFFPAWGVPDSALRYLVYAAVACFPVALVFSWFYDITSAGIVRTHPAGKAESVDLTLQRGDYLVLAGLIVVASVILYGSLGRVVDSAGTRNSSETVVETVQDKPENSLAVLPFENLDTNEDTGFFSAGVSEEILHRLASIRALKVIGRKSSFAFGDTDMSLERISNILGVRYLLNGSIRRAGDQIRVTATLVDDTGYQVWSETFDGELKGIFKFQSEIAEKVASEITRELVVLKSPVAAQTTESTEAYRYYLIGREFFNRRPPNWAVNAADAYRKSIAADPGYAPPYAGLSIALQMGDLPDSAEGLLADPKALVEHALKLDPMLAEAWMAKALPNWGNPDFDCQVAIKDLEYALELNPNLATAYNWLAICLGTINDIDGMIRARERGLAVDPLHPVLLMNSADLYLARNDFKGWKQQLMRLLDLPEPPNFVYGILSSMHRKYGLFPEALMWTKKLISLNRATGVMSQIPELISLYEVLGMPESADYWLNIFESNTDDLEELTVAKMELLILRGQFDKTDRHLDWMLDHWSIDLSNPPRGMLGELGFLLSMGADFEPAIPLLERILELDQPVSERNNSSDDIFLLHLLAYDYEQTNQQEKVNAILERAEHMTRNMYALGNFLSYPDNQLTPALNFAVRGELEKSAQALRTAFEAGWIDYYAERHIPHWRGAWESEEFAPVVADIVAALEQQRAEVEAVEAENNFRAEFEIMLKED